MANGALHIAATGIQVAQKSVELAASNVANIHTNGYKSSSTISTDLIYQTDKRAGMVNNNANNIMNPIGLQRGTGATVSGTLRNEAQGELVNTNNPLDIALTSSGIFIAVTIEGVPNNRGYSRNGRLSMNPQTRELQDMHGNALEGNIVIPEGVQIEKVYISRDGVVSYDNNNGAQITIGELPIYNFPNSTGLEAISNDAFIETAGSGEGNPIDERRDTVMQKYLEASNVQLITEMTKLIEAQQMHQALTKIMEIGNEMEEEVNSIYHS